MLYIFLDVDGVLNNAKYIKKQHKKYGGRYAGYDMPFNPKCLKNLRKLLKGYDYKIILSSSWRISEIGRRILKARLMEYNIRLGKNPECIRCDISKTRGELIIEWLFNNKPTDEDKIIVIDDDISDICKFFYKEQIIHTDKRKGLSYKDVLKGRKYIKSKEHKYEFI